jgi:hypothetical protein
MEARPSSKSWLIGGRRAGWRAWMLRTPRSRRYLHSSGFVYKSFFWICSDTHQSYPFIFKNNWYDGMRPRPLKSQPWSSSQNLSPVDWKARSNEAWSACWRRRTIPGVYEPSKHNSFSSLDIKIAVIHPDGMRERAKSQTNIVVP